MQDLVAGRIDFAFDLPVQLPLMRARNIKVYAVTSDARLAQAPDIPTMREMGLPSVSYSTWQALFAPKNVSQETVGKLNAAAVEALADQGARSRLADLGYEVHPRERQTPEALKALRKADAEKWWPIIVCGCRGLLPSRARSSAYGGARDPPVSVSAHSGHHRRQHGLAPFRRLARTPVTAHRTAHALNGRPSEARRKIVRLMCQKQTGNAHFEPFC